MANSKFFQIYKSRHDYLTQHIQIVEVALSLVKPKLDSTTHQSESAAKLNEALGVSASAYPRLSKLPAKQWQITLHNHSKQRNLEFALGELYAYFEEYVRSVVDALPSTAARYPKESANGIDLDAKQVQKILESKTTLDAAVGDCIVKSIKSKKFGKGMAEEMGRATSINIDPKIKHHAHFVLDIRNALIHNGGIASKTLQRDYGSLLTDELRTSSGSPIKIKKQFINQAISRVSAYIKHLDDLLLQGGYILPHNHDQLAQKQNTSTPADAATAKPIEN